MGYKGNKYRYDENGFLICKAYIDGAYIEDELLLTSFYKGSTQNRTYTWYINDPLTDSVLRTFTDNYEVKSNYDDDYGMLNTLSRNQNMSFNLYRSSRIGFLENNIYNYEIKDHRGTVRAVLTKAATLQNSLVQYADYLPLGGKMNGRQFTNTGAQLSLGYQGEWATDKTSKIGLIDFDFRQYDARIGRMNNIDPYRQFASGYVGMGNSWPNTVDQDGQLVQFAAAILAGAMVNVIYECYNGNIDIKNLDANEFKKIGVASLQGGVAGLAAATGSVFIAEGAIATGIIISSSGGGIAKVMRDGLDYELNLNGVTSTPKLEEAIKAGLSNTIGMFVGEASTKVGKKFLDAEVEQIVSSLAKAMADEFINAEFYKVWSQKSFMSYQNWDTKFYVNESTGVYLPKQKYTPILPENQNPNRGK